MNALEVDRRIFNHIVIREDLPTKLPGKFKSKVWKRDNYRCLWCGMKRKGKKGGTHSIHHILPRLEWPDFYFYEENLIGLCLGCHKHIHRIIDPIRITYNYLPVFQLARKCIIPLEKKIPKHILDGAYNLVI